MTVLSLSGTTADRFYRIDRAQVSGSQLTRLKWMLSSTAAIFAILFFRDHVKIGLDSTLLLSVEYRQ